MVPMPVYSSSVATPASGARLPAPTRQARLRGLASATFFSLLLVGLLAGCGSSGSSSGGTTGPTAQATAVPAIQSIPPTVAVVGTTLTYDVDAIDADSTTLIYSLDTVPTGMTITTSTGEITWTPSVNQAGDHTVVVAVSDGANRTTQRFTLSVFGVQQAASAPISAATGGTVTVNNPNSAINGLSIDIPPNALSRDETIRVSELINPPTVGGVQPVLLRGFNLEPDGIIFNSPVTITIPYNPNLLQVGAKTTTAHSLGVFFLDPATGQKVFLDNFAVDTVRNVVTGTINHFSSYALMNFTSTLLSATGHAGYLPVILLHGFGGNETSFGQLHNLLIGAGVPAYIFIWDEKDTTFIETATRLADFIETVKARTRQSKVNIIAHSFGGILARTYLQDMAGPRYRNDVNKLMTIGTPHRGIGGRFSLLEADFCARIRRYVTCIETATGIGDGQGVPGTTLRTLNNRSLPRLESLATPQYHIIVGRRFNNGDTRASLLTDDGLITTEGADICAALANGCVVPGNDIRVETIAENGAGRVALCHSRIVRDCPQGQNYMMADVGTDTHPMWQTILRFVTTGSDLGSPAQVTYTLTARKYGAGNGTITSNNPSEINCNVSCSFTYIEGTSVSLTATPANGSTFAGWLGDCSGMGPCSVRMDQSRTVRAAFNLVSPPPCPSTSLPSLPGTWTATGCMATGRSSHTATRLSNGKVLVVGGYGNSGRLASAELYDPAANGGAGAWSSTGSLATARLWHTATLLPSGEVLVVGGQSNSAILDSAELYDPAANGGAGAWTPTGNLATARYVQTATLLPNGKVLVAGGDTNAASSIASAELYDPAANGGAGAWSSTGSLATARELHTATLLPNGKVLVAGGENSSSALASAELYQ